MFDNRYSLMTFSPPCNAVAKWERHSKDGHSSAWTVSLFGFHILDCKKGFPVSGWLDSVSPIYISMFYMSAGNVFESRYGRNSAACWLKTCKQSRTIRAGTRIRSQEEKITRKFFNLQLTIWFGLFLWGY